MNKEALNNQMHEKTEGKKQLEQAREKKEVSHPEHERTGGGEPALVLG